VVIVVKQPKNQEALEGSGEVGIVKGIKKISLYGPWTSTI